MAMAAATEAGGEAQRSLVNDDGGEERRDWRLEQNMTVGVPWAQRAARRQRSGGDGRRHLLVPCWRRCGCGVFPRAAK